MYVNKKNQLRGFTLLEVIVCIVIIFLFTIITISAIQQTRSAFLRLQCSQNLRQLGLALNLYQSTYQTFPPFLLNSQQPSDLKSVTFSNSYSPFARILSFCDQQALFNSINFSLEPDFATGLSANQTSMVQNLGIFLCPSDSYQVVPGYGRINYRASLGPINLASSISMSDRIENFCYFGAFSVGDSVGLADIRDGASYTISLSERLQGDWTKNTFRSGGDYRAGFLVYKPVRLDMVFNTCHSIASNSNNPICSRGGESWFISGIHFTAFNAFATPNDYSADCGFWKPERSLHEFQTLDGALTASSLHSNGVNVLFLSGNVQFVPNTISLNVWKALTTRSGFEIVDTSF